MVAKGSGKIADIQSVGIKRVVTRGSFVVSLVFTLADGSQETLDIVGTDVNALDLAKLALGASHSPILMLKRSR